jgi:hypothetical protein
MLALVRQVAEAENLPFSAQGAEKGPACRNGGRHYRLHSLGSVRKESVAKLPEELPNGHFG